MARRNRDRMAFTRPSRLAESCAALGLALLPGTVVRTAGTAAQAAGIGCGSLPGTRTITADVVALDQPFTYNRLGASNPTGGLVLWLGNAKVTSVLSHKLVE